MVASHSTPTGGLTHNPGMCPDWESNQQPFGLQSSAQSTEPHQPGRDCVCVCDREGERGRGGRGGEKSRIEYNMHNTGNSIHYSTQ